MCPLPGWVGSTWVQRTIQLPLDPPADVLRSARLLTFMVTTSCPPVTAIDASVTSRLSPPGVRAPLAEKLASPVGSVTDWRGTPGPAPGPLIVPTDVLRLGP